jgi:hypothetical protein
MRKANYIKKITEEIIIGNLDLEELQELPDAQVCTRLCKLPGIGVWTAEMLLIFSMQRPDVLSFGDLAIQRGLRMVYHHRKITPSLYQNTSGVILLMVRLPAFTCGRLPRVQLKVCTTMLQNLRPERKTKHKTPEMLWTDFPGFGFNRIFSLF